MKRIFTTALLIAHLTIAGLFTASAQAEYNRNSSANLPALLMSFSAEMQNDDAIISWEMENQTICKWFVIERSGNGKTFDSIAVVLGTNNTHHTEYAYTDDRTLSGSNFYRLRQVDMDGTVRYSKVLLLSNSTTVKTKMKVYPNPAAAVVNYAVDIASTQTVTVQVYNLAGMVVMTKQQTLSAGSNQQSLAISNLKNGNYFLKVVGGNGTQYAQPFVKML